MKLLLDTHIFLWYLNRSNRLLPAMYDAIRDPQNEVYLSVVSLWESTLKYQLGKLPLPRSPDQYLPQERQRHQIMSLSLDELSVSKLVQLPNLHRDPFDRMLICQALTYDLTLMTIDPVIQAYPVSVFEHV